MTSRARKRELRAAARRVPAGFDIDAASAAITRRVLALPEVVAAAGVFCFVGEGHEPRTDGLLAALLDAGKTVGVPWVGDDEVMRPTRVHALKELVPGRWGLRTTAGLRQMPGPVDVAICPGMAFTARGERLGQGGGYYDRYLAAEAPGFAVGVCFAWQVVDALPTEPHDRAVDAVVTDAAVHRRG